MKISFFPLIGVLFIGLKLTNYIQWSWFWVLAPLWIGFLLGLLIILTALAAVAVQIILEND